MPATVSHALSATTPDDPAYEIRPSHWNSSHLVTFAILAAEISGLFSNANGVSFGLSNSSITASIANYLTTARASNDAIGLNTANSNVTWTADSRGLSLDARGYAGTGTAITGGSVTLNSGGISINLPAYLTTAMQSNRGSDFVQATAGFNGTNISGTIASNSISMSVAAQSNQSAIKAFGVSNTGQTAGNTGVSTGIDWVLAGSGSITLSQSTAAGGPNTAWIQHPAWLTTAMQSNAATISNINVSAGATSNNLSALVFSNSNGLAFGLSGSTVTGSYTVPTVTNSAWTLSDTATSQTIGRLALTGSNGITMGIVSSNNGQATITASYTVPTQTNQTLGLYMSSNTTSSVSSGTVDARSLTFVGAGALSVGYSNGSVVLSAPSAAAGNVTFSAGAASAGLASVVFSNSNGVSFGLNGSTITASAAGGGVAIYASDGTFSTGTVSLSASGGAITINTAASKIGFSVPQTSSLVGINNISVSSNGSTISVLNQWISSYENLVPFGSNITRTLNGASVSDAVAFNLPMPGSFSFLRIPVLMTTGSTTLATANLSASASGAIYSTWNAVVYSLGVGANSRSLQSVASGSVGATFMNSISVTGAGTQYSVTQGHTFPVEGGTSSLTTQYSISNTNYSLTTNQIATNFSSLRFIDIPFANSLSAGPYWLIFGMSTSSATNSTAWTGLTAANVRYSNHYGASQANLAFGVMGSTNLSSLGLGAGSFSTAGGGTTNSLPISAISSNASNVRPYFQGLRSA